MEPSEKCDECGYPMPEVEEYEYTVGIELSQTCSECGYKISWWADEEDNESYQSLDDGEDDPDLEDQDLDD